MSDTQNNMQSADISFIERLAQKIGITANAKYIYGEPVERDGVTVITVAQAVYGFGGGSGTDKGSEGAGGGGGGAVVKPVGYIEIKNGKTRFRPTRDPLALIAAFTPLLIFTVWGLAKILPKNKRETK